MQKVLFFRVILLVFPLLAVSSIQQLHSQNIHANFDLEENIYLNTDNKLLYPANHIIENTKIKEKRAIKTGNKLSNGIYIIVLNVNNSALHKKLIIK